MVFIINPYRYAASGGLVDTDPYLIYDIVITSVDGGTYVSSDEIELRNAADESLVRNEISAETGGTASASATFVGAGIGAANAFTHRYYVGGAVNGWVNNGGSTGWLKWQPSSSEEYVGVALTARPSEGNRMPKDFTIDYSDDNSSWTTVYTGTGVTGWASKEMRAFSWSAPGAHPYWRINITANDGGSYTGLASMRFVRSDGKVAGGTGADERRAMMTANGFNGTDHWYRVFDAAVLSGWTSAVGTTETVRILLPKSEGAAVLKWTSRSGEGNRSPKDFTVVGKSSWTDTGTTLLTVTGETGWGSLETRTFNLG